jgi:hypothetical protein
MSMPNNGGMSCKFLRRHVPRLVGNKNVMLQSLLLGWPNFIYQNLASKAHYKMKQSLSQAAVYSDRGLQEGWG